MGKAEEVLEHHGIKGQKWGIRHDPRTGRVSVDHRTVADLRKRPPPSLTNRQLQTVNTRLGLEQNFNRLNPGKIKRGESHIKAVIATTGLISSIVGFVNSPLGKMAINLINKNKDVVVPNVNVAKRLKGFV